jgi:hypothetical protein
MVMESKSKCRINHQVVVESKSRDFITIPDVDFEISNGIEIKVECRINHQVGLVIKSWNKNQHPWIKATS